MSPTVTTRRLAHEYSQVGKEINATLAKLEVATDTSERRLLLANIRMLFNLADRLFRQHHEQVRELLNPIDQNRP